MSRLLLYCVLFASLLAPTLLHAQDSITVYNDMEEGVFLWIKSEVKPRREWERWFISKQQSFPLTLVSPDRFHLVVQDQEGRQFSAGLVPLRQMISQRPNAVLYLGGIMETKVYEYREWSQRYRQWFWRTYEAPVRNAVTYELYVNDEFVDRIVAGRSN